MAKQYVAVQIHCPSEWSEVLIAALSEEAYDSFWENESGFEAYIEEENYDEQVLQDILHTYRQAGEISWQTQKVEEKNWNVEWESHFEPIVVENQCLVRATFHQLPQSYPYEIVINPKMSFGTGHHATTYLMLQWQLSLDHARKQVMDAGCGTGILSIMAVKKGAGSVLAFDNNEWAIENSRENFELNACPDIEYFLGTVQDVPATSLFDIILANINRNVLLDEMPQYAAKLRSGGQLLLSGFYEKDAEIIIKAAEKQQLKLQGKKERNDWVALLFDRA